MYMFLIKIEKQIYYNLILFKTFLCNILYITFIYRKNIKINFIKKKIIKIPNKKTIVKNC